ncbi:MAG: hypothetical protein ACFB2Z_09435 [Maricaulaceae bacterium]
MPGVDSIGPLSGDELAATDRVSRNWSERDRHALEGLLDLAEKIAREKDESHNKQTKLILFAILSLVATLVSCYGLRLMYSDHFINVDVAIWPYTLMGLASCFSILFVSLIFAVGRQSRKTKRHKFAYKRIMGLLDEVKAVQAQNMTVLERAQIEIRLSQFDHPQS